MSAPIKSYENHLKVFMKIKNSTLLLFTFLFFISCLSLEARGGRGGGGGGRGGGMRGGGNSYARTPSMSRASPARQVSPALRSPVQARQQVQQRVQQPTINRSDFINQARQNVHQNTPARANVNQGQLNQARQDFRQSYPAVRDANRNAADNVRDAVRTNRSNYRDYFGNNFNNRFDYHPGWYTPGYNAWAASNWNAVNGWLGWGWNDPYYYDNAGTYVEVPAEYYSTDSSTTAYAGTSSSAAPTGNYMTLGVFAASQNEQNAPYSNLFIQMVMDKSGVLSGTYYNAATDKIHPLDGFVDKDTQQAVWRVADNANSPVMTTGIFNLTQDMADVKVRYPTGLEQYWKLVRLQ